MSSVRQEKTALKRATGQIACSECSRLKLKCDRKLPACSSCVRRKCANLCPNGTLPQTKRKPAPRPEIKNDLAARIQQLEDALTILQSSVSTEPHPLLRDELLQIKFGKKHIQPPPSNSSADALTDSIGTLTVGTRGDTRYFGPSAGSESLLHAGVDSLSSNDRDPLYDNLERSSYGFPINAPDNTIDLEHLLQFLPPKPRAWALCESYLQQGRLKECFLEREQLINELLIPIYNYHQDDYEQAPAFSAHNLATLFLAFSVGAKVDLTLPFDNDESRQYFQLGRAALSLSPVLNSPELTTVQALALLAFCHTHGGGEDDINSASVLVSLAVKCAEGIGLHRESSQWNFDAKTLNRRRLVWWELFTFDILYSLNLGRPPTISLSYVDCQYPVDEDAIADDKGQVHPGPERWRWMFAKEVVSAVIHSMLTSGPQYSTVMDLDRKLREFPFPPHFNVIFSADEMLDDQTPYLYFKRNYPVQIRAMVTLHIHRHFFAETLLYHASDPLGSPYATSFLASYNASSVTIAMYVKHMTHCPDVLLRWWPMWTSLLAATMVVGAIVIHCPESTVAAKAYVELGLSVAMFEKGAETSERARGGLVIVRKVMARAVESFSHRHEGTIHTGSKDVKLGEELEIFAGRTKVLVNTLLSQHRLLRRTSPRSTSSFPTPEVSAASSDGVRNNTLDGLPDFTPEWLTGIPSSAEFVDPLLTNRGDTQPEGIWDLQSALSMEWFSFMEQAGLVDPNVVSNTNTTE